MLSILLSILIAGVSGIATFRATDFNFVYGITVGILVFFALQVILGLYIRKIIKKKTEGIQKIIEDGQVKINRKMHMYQQKPMGGVKAMQNLLEKEQQVFIRQALDATSQLEKFYHWNLLLKKQVSTMRMQLLYQLKEYNKVDKLINNCFYMDPMSVCMKLARLYKQEKHEAAAKFFKKKIRKFKGDKGSIVYATYSWILVKAGKIDEAIKILQVAKDKTKDERLTRNWQHLVNDKVKMFSNAGFGEEWYSLYLEQAKTQKPKQKMMRGRGF